MCQWFYGGRAPVCEGNILGFGRRDYVQGEGRCLTACDYALMKRSGVSPKMLSDDRTGYILLHGGLIACDFHVLCAAACLICAAVTASAHLHLAAQDRPCSSQHHPDNRHRKTKASINQDLSTLTKLDFQTTKHFGHASAKSASLS
jgi:hypothetical protein